MAGDAHSNFAAERRVLGIDGGGTKTEWALLSGNGTLIKEGLFPAANLRLISDDALGRMFEVLPDATHVGAFLAGCANDDDRARLHSMVQHRWPHAQVTVGSDRQSGFATAFAGGDGIAVIAGTGSAVTGQRGDRMEKAGGWGSYLETKVAVTISRFRRCGACCPTMISIIKSTR